MAVIAPIPRKRRDQGNNRREDNRRGGRHAAAATLCWIHKKYGADAYRYTLPAICQETEAPGRINAVAPGRLVHILDESSGRRFLVDTGAAYSIFPFSSSGKQSGPHLTGADGLHILWQAPHLLFTVYHYRPYVFTVSYTV